MRRARSQPHAFPRLFGTALITALALVIGMGAAPPAQAMLRWTTYDAGRTSQANAPDAQLLLEHAGVRTLIWIADDAIVSRRSDGSGWSEAVSVGPANGAQHLVGVIDPEGVVTIAWAGGEPTAISSARRTDDWSDPVVVMADAHVAAAEVALSLALVDGRPYLVASTGSVMDPAHPRRIEVFGHRNGSWQSQGAPPGLTAAPGAAVGFASGSALGVTWTQDPGGQLLLATLDTGTGQWSPATELAERMPVTAAPLAAVGANTDPDLPTGAVVWGEFDIATGTRTWRYIILRGDEVGPTLDLQSGMANSAKPTALWADGTLWVTGPDPDSSQALVWSRGVTDARAAVEARGLVPGTLSLALAGDASPMVSWLASDPGATVSLHLARNVDDTWVLGPVSGPARSGGVVSAAQPTLVWQRSARAQGRADLMVTAYADVPLAFPRIAKMRIKDGPTVTVRWRPPADITGIEGYVVQIRRGKQAWRTRMTGTTGDRTYTFRATRGVTYRARVAAIGAGERSAWSVIDSVTVPKKPDRRSSPR